MAALKGNAVVGQSGGPTAVINESLVGLVEAAAGAPQIGRLLGARHGVKGILSEQFVDLLSVPRDTLEAVAATPGAGLGSVRKKPTKDECLQMFEVMKRNDVRYFFYIGGNDSAETTHIVSQVADEAGYDLHCYHVPKTVDNDLRVNDHCPGFGSAARFVANAFVGDEMDNRSLPGVKLNVIMGRHAGFLTAASVLGRVREDDGPHLVYVPERPITREQFRDEVAEVYGRLGRCVVAVSEGIVDAASEGHKTFAEVIKTDVARLLDEARRAGMPAATMQVLELVGGIERDSHGNVQLSGSGMLGDWLAGYLKHELGGKLRVRADTLGYLQRSFCGMTSETDAAEARMCGRKAIEYATTAEPSGTVVMIRTSQDPYIIDYRRAELREVARDTRSLPDAYITPGRSFVTPAFVEYARPLAGPMPRTGVFPRP